MNRILILQIGGKMFITGLCRYWVAWFRWVIKGPYRFGDPLLGQGELRDQNRRILRDRWNKKEPQPQDFGLSEGFRLR